MSFTYFIHHEDGVTGPHDAVSLMRKVRNGTLTESTMVSTTKDGSPVEAGIIKELKELISHKDEEATKEISETMEEDSSKFYLSDLVREGFDFWKYKIDISMWTAIMMILVILVAAFLAKFGMASIAGFVGGILMYLCLTGLFSGVLNLKRGRPVGIDHFITAIKTAFVPSLLFGILFSLPFLLFPISKFLGMLALFISLLILPIFILALFCYADKNMSFTDGLKASSSLVKSGGLDMYGLMLGLVVIAVLGVLLFGLGLLLTIPVVAVGLSQVYEYGVKA